MHTYTVFVGKPEGKRPLGRLRRRWANLGLHTFLGISVPGGFSRLARLRGVSEFVGF
jgi:hypothetical protein